jgi:hypothetical protein
VLQQVALRSVHCSQPLVMSLTSVDQQVNQQPGVDQFQPIKVTRLSVSPPAAR